MAFSSILKVAHLSLQPTDDLSSEADHNVAQELLGSGMTVMVY